MISEHGGDSPVNLYHSQSLGNVEMIAYGLPSFFSIYIHINSVPDTDSSHLF